MSWERSVLPENNVLEIEGVLYDARGGHPDPQDVLQGGDVRRSWDSFHVTQVAGKWTQTGHSFINAENSIIHLVKIKEQVFSIGLISHWFHDCQPFLHIKSRELQQRLNKDIRMKRLRWTVLKNHRTRQGRRSYYKQRKKMGAAKLAWRLLSWQFFHFFLASNWLIQ